jgi:fumarylacetoacetase
MSAPASGRNLAWLPSANRLDADFPLANLPYGVFAGPAGASLAVAIGDQILDLRAALAAGGLAGLPEPVLAACAAPRLNLLMGLTPDLRRRLRRQLTAMLAAGAPAADRLEPLLVPQAGARMFLPADVGDYTDFYASIDHAGNVGKLFRPDNPLLPNYKYVPVGYHGRASSLACSPDDVSRPSGQRLGPSGEAAPPEFGPSRQLDYELEVGVFVAGENRRGTPISLAQAEDRIFGLCLLNDWSARDIQRWEYQPLGPFLGKNFATTISPWVVTAEALEPFRCAPRPRPDGDPAPLAYLNTPADRAHGGLDMTVEAWLLTAAMREQRLAPIALSRANLKSLYWTMAQMLTHHASNGCPLRPGDLLGTGTVSGPGARERGCLLEITQAGRQPLVLPNGETRKFLEDGDEVIFRAYCERPGAGRIGWGECRGTVCPSLPLETA